MNGLEFGLVGVLERLLPDSDEKQRNIELISFFYGFRESIAPTYQETGDKFQITRQRAEQIIKDRFKVNKQQVALLDGVKRAVETIKLDEVTFGSDLIHELANYGIVDSSYSPISLVRLLQDLDRCEQISVLTPDLKKANPANANSYREFILVTDDKKSFVEDGVKGAFTRLRSDGMAKISKEELSQEDGIGLRRILANKKRSWVFDFKNDAWYLLETPTNRIVKLMGKAFNLGEQCSDVRLAHAIHNALGARSAKFEYPPLAVVLEYVRTSLHTEFEKGSVRFAGKRIELSPLEQAAQEFLQENSPCLFPELRDHLAGLGFGRDAIIKTPMSSPAIFVDKSSGRQNHEYSLVIDKSFDKDRSQQTEANSRYERFRTKLKLVALSGTDSDVETTKRNEQSILRQWLFDGKESEFCALCQREYEVRGLVAAHKKKREFCSEQERTDPHIVMPVCLFGCDYLYERRFCVVKEGVISLGAVESVSESTREYLNQLDGLPLSQRWLEGPAEYFHWSC